VTATQKEILRAFGLDAQAILKIENETINLHRRQDCEGKAETGKSQNPLRIGRNGTEKPDGQTRRRLNFIRK